MTELLNGIISEGHFELPFSRSWEEAWVDLVSTMPFIYKLRDHSQIAVTSLSLPSAAAEMDAVRTALPALPGACEDHMRKCMEMNNPN